MNNKKILLIIFTVLTLGGIFWVAKNSAPNGLSSVVKKDIYYCPMHPNYTSDKPGNCPICNMKLVKKEEAPAMPMSLEKSKKPEDICILHNCTKMHDGQPCPMMVVAKDGEHVTCPICGTHIIENKKSAEKKILYWTDPMIPGYKASGPGKSPMGMDLVPVYEEEKPSVSAVSPAGYSAILITPQKQQLIGVKTAVVQKRRLKKTILATGTVVRDIEHNLLFPHFGSPVLVYANIYEYEFPFVHAGNAVKVTTGLLPGETFEGKIRAVTPRVEATTRSIHIRTQVENPRKKLRPGMYVDVVINADIGEVLALPEEALFNTGERKIVFVDRGQGIFEPRDVVVGGKAEGFYELKNGVAEGEKVVVSGNFLIDSESRLKAALDGMGPTEEHSHGQ